MKQLLLIILILSLSLTITAQELMTIRETFDYEIGDEFQHEGTATNQPPNADRINIIGKYFSEDNDTLYYIQFHDSYFTRVEWEPEPHLEYHFWTRTDTVFYANLDSSLIYFDQGFQINQYIEYSPELCDSLINGCAYESGPGYENDYIVNEYGKGLGQTYTYLYSGQGQTIIWRNTLFYYKKGGLECGIPDSTIVGIDDALQVESKFIIFPNPANRHLTISSKDGTTIEEVVIYNQTGQIVHQEKPVSNIIDISDLQPGMYIIEVVSGQRKLRKKLMIVKNV